MCECIAGRDEVEVDGVGTDVVLNAEFDVGGESLGIEGSRTMPFG